MSNSKTIAIVAVVLVLVAGIAGAFILTQNDDSDGITITDMRGREVTIPENLDSIMGIKSTSLELISFFQAVNKVKYLDTDESFDDSNGRTHNFVMKSKLSGLPVADPADPEQIIATGVDLVISSTVSVSALDLEQSNYGIPVFAINADLEFGAEYDAQLRTLGKLFGEEARAEELIAGINGMISDITGNLSPPSSGTAAGAFTTAYACGMSFYGAGTFLKASGDYLPFTYSYIQNVMPSSIAGVGKQPYNVGLETVIAANPKNIFIDGGNVSTTVNYIKSNLGVLSSIDAISDGNIYKTLVYKSWGTNWQNQLINVYYVASVMHSDVFTWDFEDKANEILNIFYPGTTVTYADLAAAQAGGGCGKVTL
jgi:ABC-type Fe3+-hydroxamate transport system, periplasmic component